MIHKANLERIEENIWQVPREFRGDMRAALARYFLQCVRDWLCGS